MLKYLKNMFNRKEKRLKKLELEVMELRLKELERDIERFENEGGNTTLKNALERNRFNKVL